MSFVSTLCGSILTGIGVLHFSMFSWSATTTCMAKLEQEIACYEANKAQLVAEHADEYVLIREDKVAGFFKSESDAIQAGYERFGNVPFLVRLVAETQTPVHFTSLYV